jgi:hypothetical protein
VAGVEYGPSPYGEDLEGYEDDYPDLFDVHGQP